LKVLVCAASFSQRQRCSQIIGSRRYVAATLLLGRKTKLILPTLKRNNLPLYSQPGTKLRDGQGVEVEKDFDLSKCTASQQVAV
jgi:hypothetical protein